MEWNTTEVGLGEQQGRNCGSQVKCCEQTDFFGLFQPAHILLCIVSGWGCFLYWMPRMDKRSAKYYDWGSLHLFRFGSFCLLHLTALIPAKRWDIITLYFAKTQNSAWRGEIPGWESFQTRGGCHKRVIAMMEELRGLIYEDGLKQLNRVAKSWPNSIGLSYALKLERNFASGKFQGHNRSWKKEKKRSAPSWYVAYGAKTRAG